MESGEACANIGLNYAQGEGVEQDYELAYEYFTKGCDLGAGEGCFNAGVMYANGWGIEQDYTISKAYYSKACYLHYKPGCDEYENLNNEGL